MHYVVDALTFTGGFVAGMSVYEMVAVLWEFRKWRK